MTTLFIIIIAVLLLLAACDLWVGVSNDAVNFMNSAIGSKTASFRTIVTVAAVGVFAGAAISNGMMDVARHGIFTPTYFSFYDVLCLFVAVMVTDVILLDIFNSLGLPTSTTVSMVFELLGGAFGLAFIKIAHGLCDMNGAPLSFGDLLNTEKALSVILGIFLSVPLAFLMSYIVQWIARVVFSFTYKGKATKRIILFGTIAATTIVWFLLINGLKNSNLMTAELKDYIAANGLHILGVCALFFCIVMIILHVLKVQILRVVVLMGTFALAMAFAGNDLVNFIGVPIAGLDSFLDYNANGNGDPTAFLMTSLSASAQTPPYILITAGLIMVISLACSRKARNVTKTEVGLSAYTEGDEMFGSSAAARTIVRISNNTAHTVKKIVPGPIARWINKRFTHHDNDDIEPGAAYDLIRASVNLVVAGLLVAFGTSHKLPLSTTYVTFMVAMGASLADRAWSRESAVYRITGVLSVIGGWFVTAGAAFAVCFLLTSVMYFGGYVALILVVILGVVVLVVTNRHYNKKKVKAESDTTFREMIKTNDRAETWQLLQTHIKESAIHGLEFAIDSYQRITDGFFNSDYRQLRRCVNHLRGERNHLKLMRRREIIGFRRVEPTLAIERNTWYFLQNNSLVQMIYSLKRTCDPCLEHVSNSFTPIPADLCDSFINIREHLLQLMDDTLSLLKSDLNDGAFERQADKLREQGDELQAQLNVFRKTIIDRMQNNQAKIDSLLVAINITQESQQIISSTRHLLRGMSRLLD